MLVCYVQPGVDDRRLLLMPMRLMNFLQACVCIEYAKSVIFAGHGGACDQNCPNYGKHGFN